MDTSSIRSPKPFAVITNFTVPLSGSEAAIRTFGLRLPNLLTDVGFEKVELTVVQPMGINGEVKLLNPITMENIADAVLQDNLASREEIDELVQELYEFAENPRTVAGLPRIFQAWGHKAASLADDRRVGRADEAAGGDVIRRLAEA